MLRTFLYFSDGLEIILIFCQAFMFVLAGSPIQALPFLHLTANSYSSFDAQLRLFHLILAPQAVLVALTSLLVSVYLAPTTVPGMFLVFIHMCQPAGGCWNKNIERIGVKKSFLTVLEAGILIPLSVLTCQRNGKISSVPSEEGPTLETLSKPNQLSETSSPNTFTWLQNMNFRGT